MRKSRILVIAHESTVPPEDISGLSEEKIDPFRMEYDVTSTLRDLGHDVRVIGILDRLTELRETAREWQPHIVFNLLDEFSGVAAYDHYVVAYLELMRLAYTGCNPRGMMVSRDKVLTKQVLAAHRIATPAFHLYPCGKRFRPPRRLEFPMFVKSATEDASLSIAQASVVDDMQSLRERVEFIHENVQSDALVEEYIDGRELYIGVLGNTRLTTLPVWEMNFGNLSNAQTRIATRKVKWDRKYQERHGIATGRAKNLEPEVHKHLNRLAKRIFRALHMSGYARLDLRMRPDGKVFLLEANANPDLTYGEDFAESAHSVGIDYGGLLTRIMNLGRSYMPEWRVFEP
ncbi:MAG TPA: D-alanine--D-alanine ligase [Gammaproteobacteria bacterium]|nr:D-alanine--D-alanine ligase [Gammaproteobacteria bacterium]